MLKRSTIQLLRFHFSLFLLPVFLFAVSGVEVINVKKALLLFVILHLMVYPSSNGYNSYMDRDETPIGGLKTPLQPTRQLFIVTIIMDIIAFIASLFISPLVAVGILLYILASRAYSYRKIRLKQYPIAGFLTVFICQGALIYFISYYGVSGSTDVNIPFIPLIISSLLIGALYPLTQVYQHVEDKKDGVTTISYLLGKKGSFVFSMLLFLLATTLLYVYFLNINTLKYFVQYLIVMLPVVLFFLYWMRKVWRDGAEANFSNSFRMNVISTLCTSLYFLLLIVQHH